MQKLFESLFEKIETDDIGKEQFLSKRLSTLNALEMTASELFAKAEEGGWDRWLRKLTLAEFASLVKRPLLKQISLGNEPGEMDANTGESHEEPKDVGEYIVDFIRANPWCYASAISSGIDISDDIVQKKVKDLIDRDEIKSEGQGETSRFALM